MIYSSSKSVAVFLNPKTGTTSLVDCMKNTGAVFDECSHNHKNVNDFIKKYNVNLDNIQMFCFYREPLERTLSMWNYIRTTPGHMVKLLHYFYGNRFPISHLNRDPFTDLTPDIQNALANINIVDFFESNFKENVGFTWPLLYPQRDWLDFKNVIMLPYSDFSNGVDKIAKSLDITNYNLETLNSKETIPNDPVITQTEIGYLKKYLQDDYDFFQQKGIVF